MGIGGRHAGGVGAEDESGPVTVPQVHGGLVAAGDDRDGVGQDLEGLGQVGESGQLLAEGEQGPGGGVAPAGVAQHRAHVEHVARVAGEQMQDALLYVGGGAGFCVIRSEELGDAPVTAERRCDVDHQAAAAGVFDVVGVVGVVGGTGPQVGCQPACLFGG